MISSHEPTAMQGDGVVFRRESVIFPQSEGAHPLQADMTKMQQQLAMLVSSQRRMPPPTLPVLAIEDANAPADQQPANRMRIPHPQPQGLLHQIVFLIGVPPSP